jgi:hypothetical protein
MAEMGALMGLVRRFLRAVFGADDGRSAAGSFDWNPSQPAPAAPVFSKRKDVALGDATLPASAALAEARKKPAELVSVVAGLLPADVADFAAVYKAAGVQAPAHGYGVDRVSAMLDHKSLAGLDKPVKASAVLAALDAVSVPLADVIHDALLRFKALVAFEAAKELELHQLRPRNERRAEELKRAIQAFQKKKQAEIEALTRESVAAAASLARLKTRQRAEEERFLRTLALFVEPMPARIVPLTPKPVEAQAAAQPPEAKPGLRLVAAEPPKTGGAKA